MASLLMLCVVMCASCQKFSANEPLNELIDAQLSTKGQLVHQTTWPEGTKVSKTGNQLNIELPKGFYVKFVGSDGKMYAATDVSVSCSCTNGAGCSAYEKIESDGRITTGCARGVTCHGQCNATVKRNSNQVAAIDQASVPPQALGTMEVEIGTFAQFHARQSDEATLEYFYQMVGEPSPQAQGKGFANESMHPVYSYKQLTSSGAALNPADLNDPKVLKQFEIIRQSLENSLAQMGITDNGKKVWAPIMVKGGLGFWQVPEAFVQLSENYGLVSLPETMATYSCSGCNGCVFHESQVRGEVIRYCKGAGCDCTLNKRE